jgi:hypothetical protein
MKKTAFLMILSVFLLLLTGCGENRTEVSDYSQHNTARGNSIDIKYSAEDSKDAAEREDSNTTPLPEITVQEILNIEKLSNELKTRYGFGKKGVKGLTIYALSVWSVFQVVKTRLGDNESIESRVYRKQVNIGGLLTSEASKILYLGQTYKDELTPDKIKTAFKNKKITAEQKAVLDNLNDSVTTGVAITAQSLDDVTEALGDITESNEDTINVVIETVGVYGVIDSNAQNPIILKALERTGVMDQIRIAVETSMDVLYSSNSAVSDSVLRAVNKSQTALTEERFIEQNIKFMKVMCDDNNLLNIGEKSLQMPIKQDDFVRAYLNNVHRKSDGKIDADKTNEVFKKMTPQAILQLGLILQRGVQEYGKLAGNPEGGYAALKQSSQDISNRIERTYKVVADGINQQR